MKENIFVRVLREYLQVETTGAATTWARRQACSRFRADCFVEEVKMVMETGDSRFTGEEQVKDYIDSLRRAPYVGMGI